MNLEFLLHLVMESRQGPRLVACKHILPSDGVFPALQDILVNTGKSCAEGHGPPLAVADNLELHAAADGLGDAKGALERLHADGLLGGLPALEAGLERVGGGGLVGGSVEGGDADAVAEGVVDARGGGGGGGVVCVVEGGGGAGGRDDSHGHVGGLGGCFCCKGRGMKRWMLDRTNSYSGSCVQVEADLERPEKGRDNRVFGVGL